MNKLSLYLMAIAIGTLISGCEKSPEEIEKDRQEKIIREAQVDAIEQGKAYQEAIKRPGVLKKGDHYDPNKKNSTESSADDQAGK